MQLVSMVSLLAMLVRSVMGAGNNKAVEKLTHNVCRVHRVAPEPVSMIFIYFLRRASPALPNCPAWLRTLVGAWHSTALLAAAHHDVLFRNLYNSLEKLHQDSNIVFSKI